MRHGFTLVEVVVAAAILLILLIGLAGAFAHGLNGFKQAQLLTLAQNLAEFQVEDIKNLAPSVLNQLVLGSTVGYHDLNYPFPTNDTHDSGYDATASANDALAWMYDSGKLSTDFIVDGLISLGGSFVAGGETIPPVPTSSDILLGPNILIARYGLDPNPPERTYWEIGTEWGYWDSATWVALAGVPPDGTEYYYRATLEHQAFPQFSRQVRIAQYDVGFPAGTDPWDTSVNTDRDSTTDSRRRFDYEVTIWYKQNGVDRVLYRVEGTITAPLVLVPEGSRHIS